MTVKITKKYIPAGTAARPGTARTGLLGVTIHNTGNAKAGANAASHAAYMTTNGGQNSYASYHYVIDDKEAFNLVPESEVTWHAGDGPGGPGNAKTISIEICDNTDGDIRKATDNAVEVAADILKRNGLTAEKNLYQHASFMAKDCPHEIRHGIPYGWPEFCEKVRVAMLPKKPAEPAKPAAKPAPVIKQPEPQVFTVKDSTGKVIGTNTSIDKARAMCAADCKIYDKSNRIAGAKDTTTVWKLYNPNSGAHHYTIDATERDLLALNGWKDEGTAWTAPVKSDVEVYRLYSGKEHLLTTSHAEHDKLEKLGWICEGTGMYSGSGQPVYRLYNPNAGMHHVTADEKEKQNLVNAGWLPEGIAFRAA